MTDRSPDQIVSRTLRRALLEGGGCEGCRCTEHRACPGGCAWDNRFLLLGRLVCSLCAGGRIPYPPSAPEFRTR